MLKIASGRHPVAEEVIFWEDAVDLWSESSGPPLASTSSDPSKLQGEFTFPFQLKLPAQITRVSAQGASRKYSLPPSFVLSSDEGLGSGEWASTRYFVKVTLRRRGLLKANDRLIVPVMFLPRHKAPVGSVERTAAQREGRPVPGPTEDPAGWGGRCVALPLDILLTRVDLSSSLSSVVSLLDARRRTRSICRSRRSRLRD